MTVTVLTDHDAIRALLLQRLATDPVRHTVLGTMTLALDGGAWAAVSGDNLASRSSRTYPVQVVGRWEGPARAELIRLLAALPGLRSLTGARAHVEPLFGVLGDDPRVEGQRLFRLDELSPPDGVPGRAVVADASLRGLARAWVAAFAAETDPEVARETDRIADGAVDGGGLFVWLDGVDGESQPVAMAARRLVLAGSARIGPVYTPPEHRGHGYGSAVTAAATRSILDDDAVPVLFTDLANPTSNKIYQQLGYRPVEDRLVAVRRESA